MNNEPHLRCWAEIRLDALRENARAIKRAVGGSAGLVAVVKANAYGHGATDVASALAEEVDLFAVANVAEASEVRANIAHPILILGPALPDERRTIVAQEFIATVSSVDEARAFAAIAKQSPALLNLEIDTGMGRMGCAEDVAIATACEIARLPNAQLHSISTHLPAAEEDPAFTRAELERFGGIVTELRNQLGDNFKVHALPTAGALAFPDSAFDFVRAGLALYGVSPLPQLQHLLTPALSLKTRIVLLREIPAGASVSYARTFIARRRMRTATLGAGYADGYVRALSNSGAAVLIRGKRCAVLGRVTMDLIVVDVSEVDDLAVGDEAVLIGEQAGEQVNALELAKRAGTIPWEIFTSIGGRVPRVYL